MSVLGRIWKIRNTDKKLNPFEKVLSNRGISPDDSDKFINDIELSNLHDPFLFPDMEKAVKRIQQAISAGERIVIFGDYDVDGISGTAILVRALRDVGAQVSYRLPNRETDGYGLNAEFVQEFIDGDIKVLITVDTGIACVEESKMATDAGIDVIITDHHRIPQEVPKTAYAILHPLYDDCPYPFDGLSGAGVSFKFASAIYQTILPEDMVQDKIYELTDLASLGTVADCVPLVGENRVIIRNGLRRMGEAPSEGLKHLMKNARIADVSETNADIIGFRIAPRLNAAGRMDNPYWALDLLLQDGAKAKQIADKLEEFNKLRQVESENSVSKAESLIEGDPRQKKAIILHSDEFHHGVIGLIASRIADKFFRPAIIMNDKGHELTGSIRCHDGFNAVAALESARDLLEEFGGHPGAAGFTVKKENLNNFKKAIMEYADRSVDFLDVQPILEIDCEVDEGDINMDFCDQIEKLGPFGIGHDKPVFVLRDAKVKDMQTVGQNRNHIRFNVDTPQRIIQAIAFKFAQHAEDMGSDKKVNLAFQIQKNRWNDQTMLQMKIVDFEVT